MPTVNAPVYVYYTIYVYGVSVLTFVVYYICVLILLYLCPHPAIHVLSSHYISAQVKNVIDGDLCETFTSLDPAAQKKIAEELDRTPGEVAKKLEGSCVKRAKLHSYLHPENILFQLLYLMSQLQES
jgi:hypothetical protein